MAKIRNIFETRKNIRKKCTTDLIMLFNAGQISLTLREWDDTIQLDKIIEMVIYIRDNHMYESKVKIPNPSYICSQRENYTTPSAP